MDARYTAEPCEVCGDWTCAGCLESECTEERECPYCGRVMSEREKADQSVCNDCLRA